jgi:hypothetical protein
MKSPSIRFVVLRHEGVPEPHFDLMIEAEPGGALITWRVADWPITREVRLTRLADHRRAYLEYEGAVSGDRGYVKRVAAGECEPRWSSKDELRVTLMGNNLTIRRLENERWTATVIRL